MISVIIPVYNLERYVSRCLDAVLAQTFTDFEVVIVDDGSTDGTAAVCRSYADRDARIRMFGQPNGGVSSARNKGLDEARGEWVTFVDGDDCCAPTMLRRIMDRAAEPGTIMSRCSYRKVVSYDVDWVEDGVVATWSVDGYLRRILDGSAEIGVWGGLYRRDLIGGLRFDTGIRHNEDKLFLFRYVLGNRGRVVCDDAQLYGYVTRPGSATQTKFNERSLDVVTANAVIRDLVRDERPDLLRAAELNLQVARLSVLKGIIRSDAYGRYRDVFRNVKADVLRNAVHDAPLMRRLEQGMLGIGDWAYIACVKLYRAFERRRIRQ